MSVDTSTLESNIITDLTAELSGDATFDANILAVKVKLAVKDVIARRCYENSTLSDTQIANDLEKYYSTIANVARYDYNQIGIEGEVNHSENGIARTYLDRNSLFRNVHSFVGVIS